jgi:hypothetical protein
MRFDAGNKPALALLPKLCSTLSVWEVASGAVRERVRRTIATANNPREVFLLRELRMAIS